MEIEELKNIIRDYEGTKSLPDDKYVSVLAVEQILKNKHIEFLNKQDEYIKHLTGLLGKKCEILYPEKYQNPFIPDILIYDALFGNTPSKIKFYSKDSCYYYRGGTAPGKDNNLICKKIKADVKTKEFIEYCSKWAANNRSFNRLKTDLGLYIDIFQIPNELKIMFSDREQVRSEARGTRYEYADFCFDLNFESNSYSSVPEMNFYYIKDMLKNTRSVCFRNDICKQFLNESQIANLYSSIEVDISNFSQGLQEEMMKYENYYKLQLQNNQSEEIEKVKRLQMQRVLDGYKQFKEAVTTLNNLKMNINIERIKLDDINSIFFKNNGLPNEKGYIEIADLFKDNMVLRMIDLSMVDLSNVDIRGMDFSGTNIHINPQNVYSKDMTCVNAVGLKFSPFTDKFDDVILNGTIIDDWEAMIELDKLKSYDEHTIIPNLSQRNKTR